ncbi:MAG: metallophosphoesterase [Acidaminococcaceae bacterium]|nr:metallophosphoesterase [Acidaminococcaceae bacterium]
MHYKRNLAIGDIYGEFKKLKALLKKVKFNPQEELLVYLGDYIDRGSEPVACFQL